MAAKKTEYGNSDISQLKGADRVRKRPAVIFGSDGLDGCEHSFFEILSNSIDEAREGHGNKIIITRYLDRSISVQDFGRGIPMDYNEKEKDFNWHLVFCEMYAGGKYNTNAVDSSYGFSLGLNGLGLCATQYASEYMDAEIHRDGFKYTMHFEKGNPVGELQKEPISRKNDTGSLIKWKPDLDVFTDIEIPLDYYQDAIKRQAIVNSGVTFVLKDQVGGNAYETYEYYYENGIVDYIKEIAGDETLTQTQFWECERRGRDRDDKEEYKVKISLAVAFSNKHQITEYYHNSSWLEHGGAPEKAVRTAFVNQIDAYIKNNGLYKKGEKINFQDVADCLMVVISSFSTITSYENQTKKSITNKFIQEAMTDFFKHQLEVYFIENKIDADKIVNQVLINMRSRVHAEASRVSMKKNLTANMDMSNRVQKFVDCRSKDVSRREVFIVEGDSALGSCKQARDAEFQAVIPVRGKILNCMKTDYPKIFKSEIITDLIKVLGCGVEVATKAKDVNAFSLDNLRWNKVIICTDADVDGYQIRTLILAMIYKLMPTLIKEGKVYIAESPLYEITCKDEVWFAYTEQEKVEALAEIGNRKYTVQRSKGLGENDADMMWLTTMNPKTRRLIQINESDVEKTLETFEVLLGDNLQGRKDKIAEEGYKYLDMLDLS
ncbi:MAG: DNA topoisomerase [Oscillospiraceae bacterium]|nr:DNA topoisomerase [Candidatus Limimonas coprohippi]MCQ2488128.1 toprim domain-containing protein [Clostridia bacterium]